MNMTVRLFASFIVIIAIMFTYLPASRSRSNVILHNGFWPLLKELDRVDVYDGQVQKPVAVEQVVFERQSEGFQYVLKFSPSCL